MWQSWFNAPDLKSDEGASPPGVRIPTSPPIRKLTFVVGFFLYDKGGMSYLRRRDIDFKNILYNFISRQIRIIK